MPNDVHPCGSNRMFLHGIYETSFLNGWPVMRVSGNTAPSIEEVKEALRPLDALICPHMRLNDTNVAAIYRADCQRLRSNWPRTDPAPDYRRDTCSSERDFTVICNFCGIHVLFCIIPITTARRHCVF